MIRRVDTSSVSLWRPTTEAGVRQCGQYAAYGAGHDFLRFYEDDNGNHLSVLENTAVLDACADSEEMRLFLTMDPEIRYVRTDKATAKCLAKDWGVPFKSEAVMQAPERIVVSDMAVRVSPSEVYPVLCEGFSEGVPPFDSWYADVHHRYRRGLCDCIGVYDGDRLAACAMTVARCETAALIGAVATLPAARGRGYASACVLTLAYELQQDNTKVMLSPKNEYAHRLYTKIGFTTIGEWGSVEKG